MPPARERLEPGWEARRQSWLAAPENEGLELPEVRVSAMLCTACLLLLR